MARQTTAPLPQYCAVKANRSSIKDNPTRGNRGRAYYPKSIDQFKGIVNIVAELKYGGEVILGTERAESRKGQKAERPAAHASDPFCFLPSGLVRDETVGCVGRDVDDSDNRAVNFVFGGTIRKNTQLITRPLAVVNLAIHRAKSGHDLENHGLQFRDFDGGVDVGERAAHVRGNQAQEFLGLRSKAANAEIAADDDDREVDAGKKIGQVVVNLSDFLVAAAQFIVDGAQFLVCGL